MLQGVSLCYLRFFFNWQIFLSNLDSSQSKDRFASGNRPSPVFWRKPYTPDASWNRRTIPSSTASTAGNERHGPPRHPDVVPGRAIRPDRARQRKIWQAVIPWPIVADYTVVRKRTKYLRLHQSHRRRAGPLHYRYYQTFRNRGAHTRPGDLSAGLTRGAGSSDSDARGYTQEQAISDEYIEQVAKAYAGISSSTTRPVTSWSSTPRKSIS